MENLKIAFIGAGNLSASILSGLIADNFPTASIWIADTDSTKLEELKKNIQFNNNLDLD